MEICNVIQKLLNERGWRVADLAQKCGWSIYSVYKWRAGDIIPNAIAMMDMADAFGVTIAEMYGRDE